MSMTSSLMACCLAILCARLMPMPAKVVSINAEEAMKVPGVVAVITAKLIWSLWGCIGCPRWQVTSRWCWRMARCCFRAKRWPLLWRTDRYAAADAVELVEVDYEELPVIVDPFEALKPDAMLCCAKILRGRPRAHMGRGKPPQPHLHLGTR